MLVGKLKHELVVLVRTIFSEIVHTELVLEKYHNYALSEQKCSGVSDVMILDEPLIVSLTTYKRRIMDVYLVVESILRQTVKPNRVILWLDEKEFDEESLPLVLKSQRERGLEIRYCSNIKSYKKIIPTLKTESAATIVTIDDDVIYPVDFIERFVAAYKKDKKCVYFYRGRYIGKCRKGFLPYGKWKMVQSSEKCMGVLPTGIGGVMYPYGCFDDNVLNEKLFTELCPIADDIWLRTMTFLKGYPCGLIEYPGSFRYSFVNIDRNQSVALSKNNLYGCSNDEQLKKVTEYFKCSF